MTTDIVQSEAVFEGQLVSSVDIAAEIDVAGMHAAMTAMRQFVAGELKPNVHYGTVPGVPKKFLWLPGAEQIFRGFNCRPEYITVHQAIDPNTGYFMFWRKCRAVNITTGKVVGEADAICTSDEFVDRNGRPLEFSKALPNGLMKADKRAFVKAARTLGCTSEFFTQDDDLVVETGASTPAASRPPAGTNWPKLYAEQDKTGQWWINCTVHGMSKARHWAANSRGPENIACTRKDGDSWCKVRVTMQELARLKSHMSADLPEESEPDQEDMPYDFDD